MTMLTIIKIVAVIGAGCGIAIVSYLVGVNQGKKINTDCVIKL